MLISFALRLLRPGLAAAVLLSLAACGGGGDLPGVPGTSSGSSAGNSGTQSSPLAVTVRVNGTLLAPVNDEYRIPATASVSVSCDVACTFTTVAENGATSADATMSGNTWSATLRLPGVTSIFTVTAATGAANSSPRSVKFIPQSTAGSATWRMDNNLYTRWQSTQRQGSYTFGGQVHHTRGVTIQSTLPNNCEVRQLECSVVSVHLEGTEPGLYAIDPNHYSNPSAPSTGVRLNVKLYGVRGSDGIYYNDDYRPTSGTVRVTRDAQGSMHFEVVGTLLVYRLSAAGGAPSAPASMAFTMSDGY